MQLYSGLCAPTSSSTSTPELMGKKSQHLKLLYKHSLFYYYHFAVELLM